MSISTTQTLNHRSQRGFTLIELSVAMVIALFLLGGLFAVVQNTRTTYGNQTALAQLQDNERLAMTLITDVVQSAGYFPDPSTHTAAAAFVNGTLAAGTPVTGTIQDFQPIAGVRRTADPGDAITVRYMTASGDGVMLCNGTSNTTGDATYLNTFAVVVDPTTGTSNLVCYLGKDFAAPAAAVTLVSGVKRLDVLYGVKRNAGTTNNVDTYARADQMTAADWLNVTSVKVKVTFANPMKGQAGQTGGARDTIVFQRIVAVMNRAGLKS